MDYQNGIYLIGVLRLGGMYLKKLDPELEKLCGLSFILLFSFNSIGLLSCAVEDADFWLIILVVP